MSEPKSHAGPPTVVLVHGAFADSSSWNGRLCLHRRGPRGDPGPGRRRRPLVRGRRDLECRGAGEKRRRRLLGHALGRGLRRGSMTTWESPDAAAAGEPHECRSRERLARRLLDAQSTWSHSARPPSRLHSPDETSHRRLSPRRAPRLGRGTRVRPRAARAPSSAVSHAPVDADRGGAQGAARHNAQLRHLRPHRACADGPARPYRLTIDAIARLGHDEVVLTRLTAAPG